jgi:hypothetical protein
LPKNQPTSNNQTPQDPNDLFGPSGYGAAAFLASGGALPHTIEFSNEKSAQVPADNVVISEQLTPNLNWSTFQLGTIGFGSYVVNLPPGLTSYSTRVNAVATLGVYVDIDANLNLSTGLLTVTFTSLDPTTLDTPANPLVGFLPPDSDPPNGEGYINYTIQPKAGIATGTTLDAQASIVFDTNAAIATPQIVNTIDAGPPTSAVTALPSTTTSTSFTVSWSGSDGAGPGIADFNVYVSDDGGAYTLWQSDTTATSATFTGLVGQTYSFYSVATDHLGLVQPAASAARATTTVINSPPPTPAPSRKVAPSDGPEVTRVVRYGRNQSPTLYVLTFNEALNPATAQDPKNYLVTFLTGRTFKVKSAVYNAAADTVTLRFKQRINVHYVYTLTVEGAKPGGVTNAADQLLDGTDSGEPGSNYSASVSWYNLVREPTSHKSSHRPKTTAGSAKVKHEIRALGAPIPAVSSGSNHQVMLTPRSEVTAKPDELIANASHLTDSLGREVDGADDGQAGSDYIATVSGRRATAGGLPMAPTAKEPATVRDAIDALLDRGELTGLSHSPRARREAHLAAKVFRG